jgi:hypothetical protein
MMESKSGGGVDAKIKVSNSEQRRLSTIKYTPGAERAAIEFCNIVETMSRRMAGPSNAFNAKIR